MKSTSSRSRVVRVVVLRVVGRVVGFDGLDLEVVGFGRLVDVPAIRAIDPALDGSDTSIGVPVTTARQWPAEQRTSALPPPLPQAPRSSSPATPTASAGRRPGGAPRCGAWG
ncbi:hypothetical protein [Actinomycetospora sp. NBRC 106378]|uniref:hypothetical protein n=1 Tax=Actinomycetospora sp. NBRC 106378 TaxID=3032208 RepID=UPI0024A2100F|nr:hypothetical protein [Actinomycetospora sp. NBRC 106378]GLZ52373.1 hypothetical protein Acsp07_19900 [Actinomycetospora sp. NBRC 106378]